ncbi:glycosyltransferase family 4 protein [Sedimentisphaera cyanobacteriorum]|nr:glycosyltransferase family 4 protein [Sedimentisphaera cyanobacteriorum]
MYKLLGGSFTFVATKPLAKERLKLGFSDMNKQHPFILTVYDSKENAVKAMELAFESDVVIHGSAPEVYVTERMKHNKLTFRYSERIFKRGIWRILDPRVLISLLKRHTKYRSSNLYMLCASAYTAGDCALVGAYPQKCFKWGYFPEFIKRDLQERRNSDKERLEILWCGRFLDWKHPEYAVYLAKYLRSKGYDFHINMIGTGNYENKIRSMIQSSQLDEKISMLGAMPHKRVRDYMYASDIFLFTSDYNEGWGAVLNESMNSGCAVLASHAIGSVPFLINNNRNGLVYKYGNIDDFCKKAESLLLDEGLRKMLGKNAYKTLQQEWNPENAAESFIDLSESLLHGKLNCSKSGPCSRAFPLKQWQF